MPANRVRSTAARVAGRSQAVAALAVRLDRASPSRDNVLAVLTYHRVGSPGDAPWLHPGLISATPQAFAEQMKFLSAHYRVVSMDQVLEARHGRCSLPPRSVLLTFDDAYADFAEHAWPVLRGFGLPVTLFVPTEFPGDPERRFWWDRLHHAFVTGECRAALGTLAGTLPMATEANRQRSAAVLRGHLKMLSHEELVAEVERLEDMLRPPPAPAGSVLGWPELNRLMAEGVTLGAHTRTHPLLNRLAVRHLQGEIAGSIQDLLRETGRTPDAFAYPGGAFDARVVEAVEEAGLAVAFTTRPGVNDLRRGAWSRLRRINVGPSATPGLLRLRLLSSLARLDRPDARSRGVSEPNVSRPVRTHGR
jgi:peptidoglycan/xylan/chitin deacetylase (PgdA/CDA1 family)